MKKRLVLGLWACVYAGAAPVKAFPYVDDTMRRPASVAVPAVSSETGLFQFAAASPFQFLIDSTHIAEKSAKPAKTFDGQFGNILGYFCIGRSLALFRYDKDTFLFWQEADPQEVVRAVADGKAYRTEPRPVYIGALSRLFEKYLQRDPKAKELLFKPFRITDLPQELQRPVASVVLDYFLDQWPRRNAHNWLHDESWQKARVQISIPPPDDGTIKENKEENTGIRFLRLRSVFDAPAPDGVQKPVDTLPFGVDSDGEPVREELRGALPYGWDSEFLNPPREASWQDEEPPVTTGAALKLLSSPLPTLDASRGEKMDAPITLSIERKALRKALDEIEKQSGVHLSTAQAPALNALLLSARAQKMPLFQLMNGLSRLYGIGWIKADKGWSADASKRTDIAVLGLRVGDRLLYRFNETAARGQKEEERNTQSIIDRLLKLEGSHALMSEPGLAFTSLPEELQKAIREQVRVRASLGRAMQLSIQQKLINEGPTLQIDPRGMGMQMFLVERPFEPIEFGRSILGPEPVGPLDPEGAEWLRQKDLREQEYQRKMEKQNYVPPQAPQP